MNKLHFGIVLLIIAWAIPITSCNGSSQPTRLPRVVENSPIAPPAIAASPIAPPAITASPIAPPAPMATQPLPPTPPQECDMSDDNDNYGLLQLGSAVILGRHRTVNGNDNWQSEMDEFVGKPATITEFDGVDNEGCPIVRVDIDDEIWAWRIRDMIIQ